MTNRDLCNGRFLRKYHAEIEYMKIHGETDDFDQAVEIGDQFIAAHHDLTAAFMKYSGKIIDSDIEVAALAYALETITTKKEIPRNEER